MGFQDNLTWGKYERQGFDYFKKMMMQISPAPVLLVMPRVSWEFKGRRGHLVIQRLKYKWGSYEK